MVVSGPNAIPFAVGKLALNDIRPEAMLVQDRACRTPESVPRSLVTVIHPVQGVEHRVLAHEGGRLKLVRKYELPSAGVILQFTKHRNRLLG